MKYDLKWILLLTYAFLSALCLFTVVLMHMSSQQYDEVIIASHIMTATEKLYKVVKTGLYSLTKATLKEY